MKFLRFLALAGVITLVLTACRKDRSTFVDAKKTDPGPKGNCNATVMRLKKMASTFDDSYISAEWNPDNTIKSMKMYESFSEHRIANFTYENNRIKEAVLTENFSDTEIYDTAVFLYDTQGRVDSVYLKNIKTDYLSGIRLIYTGTKLTKLKGFGNNKKLNFYWDLTTDNNNNITKGVEYLRQQDGTYEKTSTYTYTRDGSKSPFKGLAIYMMFFAEPYHVFWYWGDNNMTDQRYEGHDDPVVDVTSGAKYKYNDNCYPKSYANTIFGFALVEDDAWLYTYY